MNPIILSSSFLLGIGGGKSHQRRRLTDGAGSRRLGLRRRGAGGRRDRAPLHDADGTKAGYDLEMTRAVSQAVAPVVASGGAGNPEHLYQVSDLRPRDAALAASISLQ